MSVSSPPADTTPDQPRRPRGAFFSPLTLAVLLLVTHGRQLWNSFAQDDIPIIRDNEAIQSLGSLLQVFGAPYWPPPYPPELYRPVALTLFGLQWALGDGAPWVFRAGSLLLALAATLVVFRVAVALLGRTGGWVAAAVFATHPVHVEAVAVAVNQGELLATIVVIGSCLVLLRHSRASVAAPGPGVSAAILAALLVGVLTKETAAMLPGFALAMAALPLGQRSPDPWHRLRTIRPLVLGMVAVVMLTILVRDLVLSGDVKGTFTAEALQEQGIGGRALTMLGVYPRVVELLLWPVRMSADYSPTVFTAATHWGWPQTAGLVLVIGLVAAAIILWRRIPVATLAIAWLGMGYFPVSNIALPTGIVLAERTLYLPSVGIALLVGLVVSVWAARARSPLVPTVAVAAVLLLAMVRGFQRTAVWRDEETLIARTLEDAPDAYRAHRGMAILLFSTNDLRSAEQYYLRALELHPPLEIAAWELADKYRLAGLCEPAAMHYERALARMPDQPGARASLVACLAWLGRYDDAREHATAGLGFGTRAEYFARWRREMLQAAADSVPPGTIRLVAPAVDPNERRRTW